MAHEVTWHDGGFNQHYAKIGVFSLHVGWDSSAPKDAPTGFKVHFGDRTLKKRFGSLEEAKAAGIALAKKTLTEALAALPEIK